MRLPDRWQVATGAIIVAAGGAVAASALTYDPKPPASAAPLLDRLAEKDRAELVKQLTDLPDVALGSELLLHAERAAAALALVLVLAVILYNLWHHRLPTKLGDLEYPAAVDNQLKNLEAAVEELSKSTLRVTSVTNQARTSYALAPTDASDDHIEVVVAGPESGDPLAPVLSKVAQGRDVLNSLRP